MLRLPVAAEGEGMEMAATSLAERLQAPSAIRGLRPSEVVVASRWRTVEVEQIHNPVCGVGAGPDR